MRKKISQREARRNRKELAMMRASEETRLSRWGSEYPGGVNILTLNLSNESAAVVKTAQLLQHPLVARIDGFTLYLYAMRVK